MSQYRSRDFRSVLIAEHFYPLISRHNNRTSKNQCYASSVIPILRKKSLLLKREITQIVPWLPKTEITQTQPRLPRKEIVRIESRTYHSTIKYHLCWTRSGAEISSAVNRFFFLFNIMKIEGIQFFILSVGKLLVDLWILVHILWFQTNQIGAVSIVKWRVST